MAEQKLKCGSRVLLPCKCNGVTPDLEMGQEMGSGLGLLVLLHVLQLKSFWHCLVPF